jgi:phage gp29-like protein
MMGFSHAQLKWDTSQPGLDYAPSMIPWHPVYTWYDWMLRCFQAIGQDGQIAIVPGNGKWVEFAPFGSYRGWIRGAIRPCVEPWLLRHFGFRDMARFGEVHGNPTRKGYVPMVGDPKERENFEQKLACLGADTALIVPRGVDPQDGLGYDYELVEAKSTAWEVHPAQIDRCDMAIVLALLMVNLTTQVEGGSYGAAKVQMDVRSEGSQLDNQTWKRTIYNQVARPFAYLNFGDANLAPWSWWDVKSTSEYANNAKQFQAIGTAIEVLRRGGIQFDDPNELRDWLSENFGLPNLPSFKFEAPVAGGGAK